MHEKRLKNCRIHLPIAVISTIGFTSLSALAVFFSYRCSIDNLNADENLTLELGVNLAFTHETSATLNVFYLSNSHMKSFTETIMFRVFNILSNETNLLRSCGRNLGPEDVGYHYMRQKASEEIPPVQR